MTRQNAPGLISIRDPLLIVLELMRTLATSVLGEHTDQAGLCVIYGSTPALVSASRSLPTIWPQSDMAPKDRQEWRHRLWTPVTSSAIHRKQRQ
jgi:hypothetical protein